MKYLSFFLLFTLTIAGCSSQPANIREFQELVQKLDEKNNDIIRVNQEIRNMVKQYNMEVPASQRVNFLGVDSLGFSEDQQKVLEEILEKEENVSYRGLLQKITEKNASLLTLSEQLQDLQAKLPAPRRVKAGETHYELVINYLTKDRGLDEKSAKNLADKTMLIDELVPGFDVWMYYNDDTFGTFVTQGSSKVSPNKYKYSIRKEQIERETQRALQEYKDSLINSSMDTLQAQGQESAQ